MRTCKSGEGIECSHKFGYVLIVAQVDYTLPTHSRCIARKVRAGGDAEVTILEDR